MSNEDKTKDEDKKYGLSKRVRVILAGLIGIPVFSYIVAVMIGCIPEKNQLDAVHLVLIVGTIFGIILIFRPGSFKALEVFKVGNFELRMRNLESEQALQKFQLEKLENIRTILPLLLPKDEQNHLFSLYNSETSGYTGSHNMRSELRHPRSMGLIEMCFHKSIADMKDQLVFDLKDYVKLTSRGKHWITWIQEIEKSEENSGK